VTTVSYPMKSRGDKIFVRFLNKPKEIS
jgi:hypothetical protein